MRYLEYVFQLPYAPLWVPGLIFLLVVGGIYWVFRHMSGSAVSPSETAASTDAGIVLATSGSLQVKPEQRQSSRRHGNPLAVYIAKPELKSEPEPACLLDRSMGGMRLAVYHEIAVGAFLAIRPAKADDIVPWIDLEVRSCRPSSDMPGEFELGCQFVKTPPYSILMLYG